MSPTCDNPLPYAWAEPRQRLTMGHRQKPKHEGFSEKPPEALQPTISPSPKPCSG